MKRFVSMLLLLALLVPALPVWAEDLPAEPAAEVVEAVEEAVEPVEEAVEPIEEGVERVEETAEPVEEAAEEAMEEAVPEKTQEEIDLENLTLEPWQGQGDHTKDGLVFLADGTGTYTSNGKDNAMTWEYNADERKVVVTYHKYTAQTVEFRLSTDRDTIVENGPDDPQLYNYSDYTYYLQESVVKRRADEAAEAARIALAEARKKTYKLQWDETIELDFVNITLKKAKIYRVPEQAISAYEWGYEVKKGKQYFMLIGTIKNLTDNSLSLYSGNFFATATIDKKAYPMEASIVRKGETYRSNYLNGKESGTFMLIAELPEKVAKEMKSAVVEFSFRNGMGHGVNVFADGEYFFRIDVGAKQVKAARKADAKKKTYVLVNDKKSKLLAPASFVDVREGGHSWTEDKMNIPVTNQKYVYNTYSYYPRFSDAKAETVMKSYIKSLKKAGYDVTKLKNSELQRWYRNEKNTTYYRITLEKKVVGWIKFDSKYNDYFTVGAVR